MDIGPGGMQGHRVHRTGQVARHLQLDCHFVFLSTSVSFLDTFDDSLGCLHQPLLAFGIIRRVSEPSGRIAPLREYSSICRLALDGHIRP